jgi:hypothetical protein
VDTLRLAAHCRGLGFSVAETKEVVALVTASKPDCPPPDQMNAILMPLGWTCSGWRADVYAAFALDPDGHNVEAVLGGVG